MKRSQQSKTDGPRIAQTHPLSDTAIERAGVHHNRTQSPAHIARSDAFRDLTLATELAVELEYRVTELLGRGRQGMVLRVERSSHPECITHHAVKLFDPSVYVSLEEYDSDIGRIAAQVSALQQLSHPNLVRCSWMAQRNGVGIKLMELIEGFELNTMMDFTLHRKLKRKMSGSNWDKVNNVVVFAEDGQYLQPGIAFYILRKMLRGLDVLHQAGYIHSDIKPSNIMIDRFGTVKIIDFGRAVPIKVPKGALLGSPMYMAPEAHRRERITPLSDLYSAGLVTLELLHGDFLIDLDSTEEEILEFKLQLPDIIGDFLSPRLKANTMLFDILRRLLAVKPRHRYGSAAEADVGAHGVRVLHRQMLRESLDVDYGRELESYVQHRLQAERK